MSTIDKLISRFLSIPNDFTYQEAKKVVGHFGYLEDNKGRTSGSRVVFIRESDNATIFLHKPHPGNQMKRQYLRDMLDAMKGFGDLNEE